MKVKEFCKKLREMSAEELDAKERDLREDLFRLKFQNSVRKLENTARLSELSRDIARLKTVMKENQG